MMKIVEQLIPAGIGNYQEGERVDREAIPVAKAMGYKKSSPDKTDELLNMLWSI